MFMLVSDEDSGQRDKVLFTRRAHSQFRAHFESFCSVFLLLCSPLQFFGLY